MRGIAAGVLYDSLSQVCDQRGNFPDRHTSITGRVLRLQFYTLGGFLAFFVFGFVDNLKGPLLPQILQTGAYNYSQGGAIAAASYFGFVLATIAAGVLADFVGNKGVLLLAGVSILVGCVGLGISNHYPLLILFMFFIGIGLGAIELGGNGLMVELHSDARGRYLSLLSTCHGLGSLIVPAYTALLVNRGVHWQVVYSFSVVILIPLLFIFWPRASIARSTGRLQVIAVHPEESWNWRVVRDNVFTWHMSAYFLLISAYVASEIGVAAWMVEFLQKEAAMSVMTSSMLLSSFFGLIMLGRFLGAFFIRPEFYLRAITVSLLGSLLCLAASIFGTGNMIYLLPLSGLFMSITFPTIVAMVSDLHQSHVGTILGILFTFGGLGGAAGPWLIGRASHQTDLRWGIGCTIVFTSVALISLALVVRQRTVIGKVNA